MTNNNDVVTLVNYYSQLTQFGLKMEDEFKAAEKTAFLQIPKELLKISKMMAQLIETELKDK